MRTIEDTDISVSLLEQQSETIEAGSEHFHNTADETMLTARDDITADGGDSLDLQPSLNYTNGLDPQAEEVKKLESDLKLRTDSLKDSIAKNADLKSQLANAKRSIDYLESKMKGKDANLRSLTEALRILKESLENKNNSNPKETESKRNENLKIKVAGLEKRLAETTEDNNRLREAAENSQSAAQGLRITQNELLSQLTNLKKKTLCLDDNCTSEKTGGCKRACAKQGSTTQPP